MAGIYIHIPFCKQACHYCDFHFSTSLKKKDDIIHALAKELTFRKKELDNEHIETIYFGGGTPSLLSLEEIEFLIDSVYTNYKVIQTPEITIEANPDDLSSNIIRELAKSRINRLSIGIQSFFEEDLKLMNRAHNANEAKACLEEATQYFDNITIDLIYGIPGMSKERWMQNLKIAFSYNIHHISSYALTVEPKTALASFIKNGTYPNIDEQQSREHFDILVEQTAKQNFVHYEISNFGREDFFSKHNTSYWQGKSYLGIGPSAHSFNGKERSWNVSNNVKYMASIEKGELPSEYETLSKENQFNEYIMTGLRTIWGVSLHKIENDFGHSFKEQLIERSQKFVDQDILQLHNNQLTTSEKGKFLVDGIASELFLI